MSDKAKIEHFIRFQLGQEKDLTVIWSCGGGNAALKIFLEDSELNKDLPVIKNLILYLKHQLGLPETGDFSMEGNGKILSDGRKLSIDCASKCTYYKDDYNFEAMKKMGEKYTGRFELFDQ